MSENEEDQQQEVDVLSVINTSTLHELRQILRISYVLSATNDINALSSGELSGREYLEISEFIDAEISFVARCNNRAFALEMFAALFDLRVALNEALDGR